MSARPDSVDAVYAELMRARPEALAALVPPPDGDATLLMAVLRRPVPARFLELLAAAPPWSRDPRIQAAIVLNPRVPRALAQQLLPSLHWRDLADVAASPRVDAGLRVRAEGQLRELLPDLRLGERITLARLATTAVLAPMLLDAEPRVAEATLSNPRLREEDVLAAVRAEAPPRALLEAIVQSAKWREAYAVRLAMVLQPRTPLAVALGQLRALLPRDLARVAGTPGLTPLVQAAALRVAREGSEE